MTIGQVISADPDCAFDGADIAPTGVSSGAPYTVPGTGAITSWSHLAIPGPGQTLTMKVFRKVSDTPLIYRVVGHDGPRPISPALLNTFQTNVPVQAGDILGMQVVSPSVGCNVATGNMADTFVGAGSDLADGDATVFSTGTGRRWNISAAFAPSNALTVGNTTRNKRKGTATLNLTLPNPGELTGSGKGVKASSARAVISKSVPAGPAKLVIKAKGKRRKTLNETGKVKLKVTISYTPTGGDPASQSVNVKLKKT